MYISSIFKPNSKILLSHGTLVSSEGCRQANILIQDGIIQAITNEKLAADRVIDCSGKHIFAGLIDSHVHFRDPGHPQKEDFATGSQSAIAGGITTVFDMPNTQPIISTVERLEEKKRMAAEKAYCNYGIFIGYVGNNIEEVNRAENVPGVKLYTANSTGNMGSGNIEELFAKSNKLIMIHAEDEGMISQNKRKWGKNPPVSAHSAIRSTAAAVSAVKMVCELAKKYQRRIHIAHISTQEELEVIKQYRDMGVTCEVTPHHLFFNEEDYAAKGSLIQVNPPVRTKADVQAMWQGIQDGLIDTIGTDHAPHTMPEKTQSYPKSPSGIPSIQVLLPLLLNAVANNQLSLPQIAKMCCEKPASLFGIQNKGYLKEGFDADLTIVDTHKRQTLSNADLFTRCGWSPYEGRELQGVVEQTILGGDTVYSHGSKEITLRKGKEVNFR